MSDPPTTVFVDVNNRTQFIISDWAGRTLLSISYVGQNPEVEHRLNKKQTKEIILRLFDSWKKMDDNEDKVK